MSMDREKMERGVRLFLEGLGREPRDDDLERTPARVARAWIEDLTCGYAIEPLDELTWTPAPAGTGPVVVRRISVASVCVHHLLPFFGFAHVAYLPDQRLAGLSKLGRVVDAHARRLQTQENLTTAIVATLDEVLEPHGTAVMIEAEHTCMTLRGVRERQSELTTVATSGIYADQTTARAEILGLLRGSGQAERG
jgi:GTP cyclohydrolase I